MPKYAVPRYAVVVCPACRSPFIVEPGPKTVACRHCNKRHETAKLRTFLATDDFGQAQAALGSINAHICGDPSFDEEVEGMVDADASPLIDRPRYKRDKARVDARMRAEAKQTRLRGQAATLTEAFDALATDGDVDIEEYWAKVSPAGIPRKKFDEWVEKMITSGVAHSPRFGFLRKS